MSEQFLYKLKSIRERYGIEKSQQRAIPFQQAPQPVPTTQRQHSTYKANTQRQNQPTLFQQKPYESQRPHSMKKTRVNLNCQNNLTFHFRDSSYRQKLYQQPQLKAKPRNNYQPESSFRMTGRTHRLLQQHAQRQNNFDLIYNYDDNPYELPQKSKFETQFTFQRQPLKSIRGHNNITNIKYDFDSQQIGIQHRQHSLSVANTNNKSQIRPDWNIDKLCMVQQKIQAYLLRR